MTPLLKEPRCEGVKDYFGGGQRFVYSHAFACDSCGLFTVVAWRGSEYHTEPEYFNDPEWYPQPVSRKEFPDVPEHIATAGSEAHACLGIGADRAACALARAVVEATAKDKKITKGLLHAKIDALFAGHFISEYLRDAAHQIRLFGNDVAHGDFADPVQRPEAELVVELMDEILAGVYQSPAKVGRLRAAREKPEAAAKG